MSTVIVLMTIGMLVYFVTRLSSSKRRGAMIQALGSKVEFIDVDANKGQIRAKLRGVIFELSFVSRGSGSSAESWTEVRVADSCQFALLRLMPQTWWTERQVAQSESVDVVVGDAQFDSKYHVELAPASLVGGIFSPAVCELSLQMYPLEMDVGVDGILIAKRGWFDSEDKALPLCELACELVVGVARAKSSLSEPTGGLPYRDTPLTRQHAANEEVMALEAMRAVAREKAEARNKLFGGVALALFVLFMVWRAFSH